MEELQIIEIIAINIVVLILLLMILWIKPYNRREKKNNTVGYKILNMLEAGAYKHKPGKSTLYMGEEIYDKLLQETYMVKTEEADCTKHFMGYRVVVSKLIDKDTIHLIKDYKL